MTAIELAREVLAEYDAWSGSAREPMPSELAEALRAMLTEVTPETVAVLSDVAATHRMEVRIYGEASSYAWPFGTDNLNAWAAKGYPGAKS